MILEEPKIVGVLKFMKRLYQQFEKYKLFLSQILNPKIAREIDEYFK